MEDIDMEDIDTPSEDCPASARGIIDCLRMLVEEAAGLRLNGTTAALERAIAVCTAECADFAMFPPDFDTIEIRRRPN